MPQQITTAARHLCYIKGNKQTKTPIKAYRTSLDCDRDGAWDAYELLSWRPTTQKAAESSSMSAYAHSEAQPLSPPHTLWDPRPPRVALKADVLVIGGRCLDACVSPVNNNDTELPRQHQGTIEKGGESRQANAHPLADGLRRDRQAGPQLTAVSLVY